jgi:hypothetical protein
MAKLAKNIKVPRQTKIRAALAYPNDRHLEKGIIRSEAAAIHDAEMKARSRGKEKKAEEAK